MIDSLLDWSSHVQYVKSKLVRASHLFYKIQNVVSVDVLTMLYFSLVHCHPKYCIVSWDTATYSVLQPLEVAHNNILRSITYNNFRCHITPLYKSLNILKLHDIYKLELAEMLPISFKDLFLKTAEVNYHNTRYATNQTILCKKFQQMLAKKQFLIVEMLFGQMQKNNSKIYPITPLVMNTDNFCCCNMNECLKNHTTGYI